jgi:hypothetical protein
MHNTHKRFAVLLSWLARQGEKSAVAVRFWWVAEKRTQAPEKRWCQHTAHNVTTMKCVARAALVKKNLGESNGAADERPLEQRAFPSLEPNHHRSPWTAWLL